MKRYHLQIQESVYAEVTADGATFVSSVRKALRILLMLRRGEVKLVTKEGKEVEVL